MRFPQYSDFFSDPPFGFDLFHRRRQNYDAAVREIPVQFDPFSSLHTFRQNRATDNRSAFSDFDGDIPEDFWEPVIRQDNKASKTSNTYKKLKKDRKQLEETSPAFLYLSDDESCDINNSGVSTKSRDVVKVCPGPLRKVRTPRQTNSDLLYQAHVLDLCRL